MKLTFIDANILIAAVRGEPELARRAMEVLDDPERIFASSEFVRLEVLPKAHYQKSQMEVEFYEAFFAEVSNWARPLERVVQTAFREAMQTGLSAMDALHVAAAAIVEADELITAERTEKPIHRTTLVTVRTIRPV